ncbi:NADH-ubiquinone oxidoreductase chain 6 [Lemmus lemmus]
MTESLYILSLLISLGCLGTSLMPSPIYDGLCLIISGCSGCLAVLGFGGSFLGLIVFLFIWEYISCIWLHHCYIYGGVP